MATKTRRSFLANKVPDGINADPHDIAVLARPMPLDPDLTLADPVEPLLEIARDGVEQRLDTVQKHLGDSNAGLPDKLAALSDLPLELLPVAFGEAYSPLPNVDRSAVIGRAVTVTRGVVELLLAAHAGTVSDELNPRSRRFQTAFLDFFGLAACRTGV
jgi:hypothetical protein